MDAMQMGAVAAVFVLAGAVKGITGMGLPTVAVSLLGLWMAPMQAAALLVLPSLATNVAQCAGPHWRALIVRLWPAWLALAVVTIGWPQAPSASGAQRALGALLVIYGLWGLWRPVLPDLSRMSGRCGAPIGALVGAATGMVTVATAVFVMPLVPYLQALRLDKDAMVQALGLSFTVATLALAWRLQAGDHALLGPSSALALAAAFAGLWVGAQLRRRISSAVFQRALFVVFIGLGLANLLRSG
jgi:uncharacterized membrane protein YfcA